jgi:predicted AAA+ superfamily ATPase
LLFLQNIFTPETLEFYPKLGNVFESFVVEELIRGVQAVAARNLSFYHFRTKAGGEIDLILEGSFGLLPIEIKYQSNTTKKQLTSMINFIELHQLAYGLVANNCESPSMVTEKIMQIPITCL